MPSKIRIPIGTTIFGEKTALFFANRKEEAGLDLSSVTHTHSILLPKPCDGLHRFNRTFANLDGVGVRILAVGMLQRTDQLWSL